MNDSIVTSLVLEEWARYPGESLARRLDLLKVRLPDLILTATALRAVAEEVAEQATPEGAAARVAAGEAARAAADRRFAEGGRAVLAIVERENSASALQKAERELASRERAYSRLQAEGGDGTDELIAEGALLAARERVERLRQAAAR